MIGKPDINGPSDILNDAYQGCQACSCANISPILAPDGIRENNGLLAGHVVPSLPYSPYSFHSTTAVDVWEQVMLPWTCGRYSPPGNMAMVLSMRSIISVLPML